jgi:hypothetical protein
MLRDQPNLEIHLLSHISRLDVDSLQPIEWDETTSKVWLGVWEAQCREKPGALEGITMMSLPAACLDKHNYAKRIRPPRGMESTKYLLFVLGAGLTVCLSRHGWAIDAGPGEPVTASRNGVVLKPFDVPVRLSMGQLKVAEWEQTCRDSEIGNLDLSEATAPWSELAAPSPADG